MMKVGHSENVCHYSVKKLNISPTFQNTKIRVYKRFGAVACGWETWFLTLRDEHKVLDFEKEIRKVLGPTREKATEQFLVICTGQEVLLELG